MTRFFTAVAMACAFAALAIPSAEARPRQVAHSASAGAGACYSIAPGREACPGGTTRTGGLRPGGGDGVRVARSGASTSRNCLTADTRAVLDRAERYFGVTFKLVSTCRPGAFIAGTNHLSEHSRGRAVDLLVPRGISKQAVVRWLYANASGVTMVYRGMAHVHFDTGPYHALAWGGCGRKPAGHPRVVHAGASGAAVMP